MFLFSVFESVTNFDSDSHQELALELGLGLGLNTGRASPQPGPGGAASLASLVMCDCFQRPQLVLEIELGALNEPARQRQRRGGGRGLNLNGCGNWGAVECFMRLPQAAFYTCLLFPLIWYF